MPTTKMATGHTLESGKVQLAIRMPKPLFQGLQKMALDEGTSMDRKVQELIAAAVKASKEVK